jgi:hypothetical protein
MVNENWARWIHASVAKYLKTVATNASIVSLCEGLEDRHPDFQNEKERAEIRVSGPFTHELGDGDYHVQVFVNVLVSSMMGGAKDNVFQLNTNLGKFHAAMDAIIPLYKLGPDTGPSGVDDGTQFGCLRTKTGRNDSIRVMHFGQIDKTNRLRQAIVDAAYVTTLSNN